MAGFIVLWALMDMTVPGACQSDDLESTPASAQDTALATTSTSGAKAVSSSTPNDNSASQPGPEDCFCCCSHIAPTGFFHVAVLFSFVGFELPYSLGSPHDFSTFLYHPPKA